MFAVIKTGGKQYRVAANDVLKIERVAGEAGDIVTLGQVLAFGDGDDSTIGAPFIDDATVTAEVVEQGRAKTVIAFKKRRRQNSRRTRGHRQLLTTVRISEILTGGAKPSKKAAAKPEAKTADATPETRADAKPAAKPEAEAKKDTKAETKPAKAQTKKEAAPKAAKKADAPEKKPAKKAAAKKPAAKADKK